MGTQTATVLTVQWQTDAVRELVCVSSSNNINYECILNCLMSATMCKVMLAVKTTCSNHSA